jgi:hypothetical protein
MPILLIGLGAVMALTGLYAVFSGWGVVVLERGWTMIIAGSTFATGGLIIIALGLMLRDMRRLLAVAKLTPNSAGAPELKTEPKSSDSVDSAVSAPAPDMLTPTGSSLLPAAAAVAGAAAILPVALGSAFKETQPEAEIIPAPVVDEPRLAGLEPKSDLNMLEPIVVPQSEPTSVELNPLDAFRSVLDTPMAFEERDDKLVPGKNSDRFAELLRPVPDVSAQATKPLLNIRSLRNAPTPQVAPLENVRDDIVTPEELPLLFAADEQKIAPDQAVEVSVDTPAAPDLALSEPVKDENAGGLANRWSNRARGGKRIEKKAAEAAATIDIEGTLADTPAEVAAPIELAAPSDVDASRIIQPEPASEIAAPDMQVGEADVPTVVRTYTSGEHTYMMFSDGSIEADTPEGVFKFGSIDELKTFIASRSPESGM